VTIVSFKFSRLFNVFSFSFKGGLFSSLCVPQFVQGYVCFFTLRNRIKISNFAFVLYLWVRNFCGGRFFRGGRGALVEGGGELGSFFGRGSSVSKVGLS